MIPAFLASLVLLSRTNVIYVERAFCVCIVRKKERKKLVCLRAPSKTFSLFGNNISVNIPPE